MAPSTVPLCLLVLRTHPTSFYLRLGGIFLVIALPLRLALRFIPGGNTLHLLVVLVVAGLGYVGAARVFKIEEVGSAFKLLLRR